MVEPTDAILPLLKKIQDSLVEIREEQQLAKERDIEAAEAIMDIQDVVTETPKDNLAHLGLTTRHRMDFEKLSKEMAEMKKRIAVLESRS